ncbi:Nuclear protein SNF4 [Pleurostoma richardsiae]|uniref:Nuclear protein SNF4 n=1 Tax=Pleurostoma richardsiae TaxID=41990 RepID=A0AA38RLS4_9PEZI|nr:Nuclear protein SNF4 [Pleurostoma richardsiae]
MDDDTHSPAAARANPSSNNDQGQPSAAIARPGHELGFVAPSSYLRPSKPNSRPVTQNKPPMTQIDKEQMEGLRAIREFLKIRNSYDVLPLSYRLIVLDNDLLIKKSLNILIQNSIVSAPLWDSHNSAFAGLLTSTDYINVIQYYCQFPDEIKEVDQFRLSSLRDIERAIGVMPLETVSVHPMQALYVACLQMLKTRARRIPLVDVDDETGREMVVSVITQYRILKFIAVNNEKHTFLLKKPVRDIGLGTYTNLATATMDSSVLDVIHLMVKHNISAVPIVDSGNRVLNVFEAVDVIPCIKGGAYDELSSSVGEALSKRAEDFPGIYTCSEDDRLDSIFETIRKSRVHRLIVVDDDSKLRGIISLSDILKYVLLYGEEGDKEPRTQ